MEGEKQSLEERQNWNGCIADQHDGRTLAVVCRRELSHCLENFLPALLVLMFNHMDAALYRFAVESKEMDGSAILQ